MKKLSITQTAFGAALALALTLSGVGSPAFAAAPTTADESLVVRETGRRRPPRPAADFGPMFRPDLRVKYLGPDYDNGKYYSRFLVENVGAASADDVFVDQEVEQRSYDGSIGVNQSVGGHKIATLASDQSVEVKVTCIPLPGYVCTGASIKANVEYDLDPSNNKAHSN
jgi:hypothetical protein